MTNLARIQDPDIDLAKGRASAQYHRDFLAYLLGGAHAAGLHLGYGPTGRAVDARSQLGGPHVVRALGTNTLTAGGYFASEPVERAILAAADSYSVLRTVATVQATPTGRDMVLPTDGDATEGALVAENTDTSEADPAIGAVTLRSYLFTSRTIRFSFALDTDGGQAFVDWLAAMLGRRLGRAQNRQYTIGAGGQAPTGILYAASTVTAQGATAITPTDLETLAAGVEPTYWLQSPDRTGFMGSATTLQAIKGLRDAAGAQTAWQPDPTGRHRAGLVVGHPYFVNPAMPSAASGERSLLFGNYEAAVLVRDVQGVSITRLAERFADRAQVGILAHARGDVAIVDSGAIVALVH